MSLADTPQAIITYTSYIGATTDFGTLSPRLEITRFQRCNQGNHQVPTFQIHLICISSLVSIAPHRNLNTTTVRSKWRCMCWTVPHSTARHASQEGKVLLTKIAQLCLFCSVCTEQAAHKPQACSSMPPTQCACHYCVTRQDSTVSTAECQQGAISYAMNTHFAFLLQRSFSQNKRCICPACPISIFFLLCM